MIIVLSALFIPCKALSLLILIHNYLAQHTYSLCCSKNSLAHQTLPTTGNEGLTGYTIAFWISLKNCLSTSEWPSIFASYFKKICNHAKITYYSKLLCLPWKQHSLSLWCHAYSLKYNYTSDSPIRLVSGWWTHSHSCLGIRSGPVPIPRAFPKPHALLDTTRGGGGKGAVMVEDHPIPKLS